MGEKSPEDPVPPAVQSGFQGQFLIGGDIGDQPRVQRVDRLDSQRSRPFGPTAAWVSITASSGRKGSVPLLYVLTTW